MNILFFLTPKSEVSFLYEDESLQQAMEKMEEKRYSCVPILTREGKYSGTMSEGDLLWTVRHMSSTDLEEAEKVPILTILRRSTYKPVHVTSKMEDLLDRAINQNFVPVVDDSDAFIGIITRKEIIKYCYERLKRLSALEGDE